MADILIPAGVAHVEIELEQTDGTVRLHLRVNDNEAGRESITEKALESIAMHERLLCLDGSAELHQRSADLRFRRYAVCAGRSFLNLRGPLNYIRFTGSISTVIATSSGKVREAINPASFWLNKVICRVRNRM